MIFGVGIGGDDRHELEVWSRSKEEGQVRANESLTIIRRLLEGESVTFLV